MTESHFLNKKERKKIIKKNSSQKFAIKKQIFLHRPARLCPSNAKEIKNFSSFFNFLSMHRSYTIALFLTVHQHFQFVIIIWILETFETIFFIFSLTLHFCNFIKFTPPHTIIFNASLYFAQFNFIRPISKPRNFIIFFFLYLVIPTKVEKKSMHLTPATLLMKITEMAGQKKEKRRSIKICLACECRSICSRFMNEVDKTKAERKEKINGDFIRFYSFSIWK